MANQPDELTVLKALGDETRYAMYRELSASTAPLAAPELADRLGLHANTVRLHLERLRDAGLLDAEAVHRGTVGRPQHLYFLADGAPGLGFDPPAHALLAGLLASLAERVGADPDDAADTGHAWGAEAGKRARTRSCLRALDDELAQLGFEPQPTPPTASTRAPPASSSSIARSASSPRRTPSWSATCTAACARAWSTRSAGGESRSSPRCTIPSRAT